MYLWSFLFSFLFHEELINLFSAEDFFFSWIYDVNDLGWIYDVNTLLA